MLSVSLTPKSITISVRWAGVGNSFIGNRIYEAPHQGVEGGGSSAKCGVCVRGRKGDLECEYTGNGTAPGMDDATCGANDNLWRGNVLSNLTWEGSDAGGFYVCGQDGTGYTSRGNVVENNLCAFSLSIIYC